MVKKLLTVLLFLGFLTSSVSGVLHGSFQASRAEAEKLSQSMAPVEKNAETGILSSNEQSEQNQSSHQHGIDCLHKCCSSILITHLSVATDIYPIEKNFDRLTSTYAEPYIDPSLKPPLS